MSSNEAGFLSSSDSYEYNTPHFSNYLLSSLFNLQKSGVLCDVTFTSDNTSILAHSCLLVAISPFMARFINSYERPVNSSLPRYNLPITLITKMVSDSIENCMECLSQVVGYIYSGNIVISSAHFQHIANISCNLEINELITICREFKHNNDVIVKSENIFEDKNDDLKLFFYDITDLKKSDGINYVNDGVKNEIILTKRKISTSDCSLARNKSNISDFNEFKSLETRVSEKIVLSELPSISNVKFESDLAATSDYGKYSDKEVSITIYDIKDYKLLADSNLIDNKINITSSTEVTNVKSTYDSCLPKKEETKLGCVDKDFQTDLLKINSSANRDNVNKFKAPKAVRKTMTESQRDPNCEKHFSCDSCYSCLECRKYFNCIDTLLKHRSDHHSYKYICIYCNFKCNSLQNITKHLLITKHGNKCSICFDEFDNKLNFLKHCHRNHNFIKKFTCFLCNVVFESRNKFKNHLKTHKIPEIIKCRLCSEEFFNEVEMGAHFDEKHKTSCLSCEFCSYETKFPCYLKRHMLKHNRKLLSCSFPDCDFQTVWLYNLKNHWRTHGNFKKEFSCNICNVQFSLKKNLMRHYFYLHGNSKEFNCPLCNYNNKRMDKVRDHCRSSHEGNKEALFLLNKQLPLNCYKDESIIEQNLNYSSNKTDNNSTISENNVKSSDELHENSRVVYLNENTGDLTFFCDSNGKPLKGVPDVITIHSINTINNSCNFDGNNPTNSTSVILNETTGELTCINLNFDCNMECGAMEKQNDQNPEIAVTVLDETTGEITSKNEQIPFENENITDLDNIFDTIDFDAMNDDSFDGFDDFDNALFDAEFSAGSASPDMDKILNEYTGELFIDNSACRFSLNKQMNSTLWENNQNKSSDTSNSQQFAEIFLDEVTGEFSGLNYN